MLFNTAGYAPQQLGQLPGFGRSMMPAQAGMSMMMAQLQQQLMVMMASMLGSFLQSGASGGSLPMNAGFGGATDGMGGLSNFLGGSAPMSFGGMSPAGGGFGGLGGASGGLGGRGNVSPNGSSGSAGSTVPRGRRGNSDDSQFTTLNVNIKSRPAMPQNKVVADVRKAAKNADLIGWNEISLDRYRDAIKDLGPEWGHYMPKDGKYPISNPISYKKDEWKMLKGGFQKTHDGAYGICPDRYITWAKLKHKGSGEKIVRINTHTVAGAFSKGASHADWRRKSWNTHMGKLSNMVKKFESQGYKVIIAGDMNKDSSKVLGNQVKYDNKLNQSTTDGGSTLDYLMHTGNGLQTQNAGVLGGFNSDHHAVYGTYNLR